MTYTRCLCCNRTLVPADKWKAIPITERVKKYDTHARRFNETRCHNCRPRDGKVKTADDGAWTGRYAPGAIVIEGGWWMRRGLVLVPVGPRPVDRPDVGRGAQPINHGTDGGYHVHRRRCETPCDACRDAHRAAEREREARKREVAA